MIFRDIDYNSKTEVFRDVISLLIDHCDPRRPRAHLADTKCLQAAQRMQAKRACIYRVEHKCCPISNKLEIALIMQK